MPNGSFDHLNPSTSLRTSNKLGIFNRLMTLSEIEKTISMRPTVLTDSLEEVPTCGWDSLGPCTVIELRPFFFF